MLNKVVLIGRVANEIKEYNAKNNLSIAKFNLAVNRMKDKTDFIPIVAFGKLAELCKENLSKGRLIAIEGAIAVSEYKNNDKYRKDVAVIAEKIKFLDKKREEKEEFGEVEIEDIFSDIEDDNIGDLL